MNTNLQKIGNGRSNSNYLDYVLDCLSSDDRNWMKLFIGAYPNKRVIHLAQNHHSEKIRKKNIARVFKWISKIIKRN